LTDVEGDGDYLDRFVQQSKILTFRPVATDTTTTTTTTAAAPISEPDDIYFPYRYCLDFQTNIADIAAATAADNDNDTSQDMLVFGGDVWDQGGSDLYVIRQLLDLQRRYPDRVHFVMGNRDVNKMRVVQELGAASAAATSNGDHDRDSHPPNVKQQQTQQQQRALPPRWCYWLKEGSWGDPDEDSCPTNDVDDDSDTGSKCAADRLRWMLKDTMGSPKAFEHRRSGGTRTILLRDEEYW
jgi:hypothetical protein